MTEYDELLRQARNEAERIRTTARKLVSKMYEALRRENSLCTPQDARERIEKDCIPFWSRRTILEALPDEAKDAVKQQAGRNARRKPAAESAAMVVDAAGYSLVEGARDSYPCKSPDSAQECGACQEKERRLMELEEALGQCSMLMPDEMFNHTAIIKLDLKEHGSKLAEVVNDGFKECFLLVNKMQILKVADNHYDLENYLKTRP